MNLMSKVKENCKKFGFSYTFFFILQKLGLKIEIPIKSLLKKQHYYENLSIQEKKDELCKFYKNSTGKELNIENPKTFCEKLQWMKFNNSTKEKALLSDKYMAPKIIEKRYGSRIKTVKQLGGGWKDANDIDFEKLPQSFVLKCNHGSAMNIIVKDKNKLNTKKTIKKLNNWLKIDYATVNGMYENHYSLIDRKIIAEEFIQEIDGNLHDYKFHCFNGVPMFCQLIGDRVPNSHHYFMSFYTSDWKKIDLTYNNHELYKKDFPVPVKFSEMLSLAADMSKDFSYVRVDFYLLNNEIYFSELTFTPDSGIMNFSLPQTDLEWGNFLKLPQHSQSDKAECL